MKDQDVSK